MWGPHEAAGRVPGGLEWGRELLLWGVICELASETIAFMTVLGSPDTAFSGVPGPHGTRGNTESHSKAVCRP